VSADAELVRSRISTALRRHPRVAYQQLLEDPAAHTALAAALPDLVPFGSRCYHEAIAVLDWDHRLPTRSLLLRLYLYYDADSTALGEQSYDQRTEEIAQRDRFPEFDVPDYEALYADEAYDVPVDLNGASERPRLVSEWRRHVRPEVADGCVEVVRASREFRGVRARPARADGLGDLEAVSWSPPCESDYPAWTVDVWYLTEFDGLLGQGYSFVVDPGAAKVVMAREFVVRASPTAG
jgi:hypothetical protein